MQDAQTVDPRIHFSPVYNGRGLKLTFEGARIFNSPNSNSILILFSPLIFLLLPTGRARSRKWSKQRNIGVERKKSDGKESSDWPNLPSCPKEMFELEFLGTGQESEGFWENREEAETFSAKQLSKITHRSDADLGQTSNGFRFKYFSVLYWVCLVYQNLWTSLKKCKPCLLLLLVGSFELGKINRAQTTILIQSNYVFDSGAGQACLKLFNSGGPQSFPGRPMWVQAFGPTDQLHTWFYWSRSLAKTLMVD